MTITSTGAEAPVANPTLAKTFSERLRATLRAKRKGMPVKSVAFRAGYSEHYIAQLAGGRAHNPSLKVIEDLSTVLGVSPAWLLGFQDTMQ